MKKNTEQLVAVFAKAWETLDEELIINNLDESFVYDSQWAFESLDYARYKEYIRAKFNAIRESASKPIVKIVPDMEFGGSMVSLSQGTNAPAYYRIKTKDGKVIKGDLCMF